MKSFDPSSLASRASRRRLEEALAAACRLQAANQSVSPTRRRSLFISLAAAVYDHLNQAAALDGLSYDSRGATFVHTIPRALD
jgi:hypothetical protein